MFSFFKKNKRQKPEWSPFDTIKDHDIFEKELAAYFKGKGIAFELLDGYIKVPGKEFDLGEFGLSNIAQFCKNEGVEKSKEHIAGHFESLIRGHQFNKQFDRLKTNYEAVKKYLGVRLYNIEYFQNIGVDKAIGRNVGGDLYAILIYDLPDTVQSVSPKDAEAWNIDPDELWNAAEANIYSLYPPNIMDRELQGLHFKTVEEDHFFSPNIIFQIDNYPELIGTYGSLISMPTRHIVIIYPVENIQVVQAIQTQITVSHGVSARGPGTLSNQLYWYNNGKLTHQPSKIEDQKLEFMPTKEFVGMLNAFQN